MAVPVSVEPCRSRNDGFSTFVPDSARAPPVTAHVSAANREDAGAFRGFSRRLVAFGPDAGVRARFGHGVEQAAGAHVSGARALLEPPRDEPYHPSRRVQSVRHGLPAAGIS